jgi:hypothetical protein
MAKSKTKKSTLPKEFTQLSSFGLDDSELITTIFLADDDGNPVVLIRFTNFDDTEQAQDFISVFKKYKSFQEIETNEKTIH